MIFKTRFITSSSLNTAFETKYHSDTKQGRARRQLKDIKFANYQANNRSDTESFKEMIADMERLSSSAHDEDQRKQALCACLWIAIEGQ